MALYEEVQIGLKFSPFRLSKSSNLAQVFDSRWNPQFKYTAAEKNTQFKTQKWNEFIGWWESLLKGFKTGIIKDDIRGKALQIDLPSLSTV